MENKDKCEKLEKCPISDILKNDKMLTGTYKRLFCEAGEKGKQNCKRYQIAKKIGSCPINILPNTPLSVDEIIKKIQ